LVSQLALIKIFLIIAGLWNAFDGAVSLRLRSLGHSAFSDACRVVRALLGVGLILAGFYL